MESEFLRLQVWDQFDPREAQTIGKALAACLPSPWAFDGVEKHACGEVHRQVAFYRWRDGARFALIPGGDVTLGHDPKRPFGPFLEERRRWLNEVELPEVDEDEEPDEETADLLREHDHWSDFFDWLSRLPGPRSVRLEPFLIETQAWRCGDAAADLTFRALRARLSQEGLRLPTSDEWEHACAGGARTIWRWGDFCFDHAPEDEGPDLPHCRPLVFGLSYRSSFGELCGEEGLYRHSDGGVAMCGGHGFPCAWLSMASATIRDRYALGLEGPDKPLAPAAVFRRAFSVPPEAMD